MEDTDSSITDEDSATLALAKADDDQDDDDASIEDETLFDRVYALRDMIPPKQRVALASSFETGRDWVKTGLRLGGKTLWVVSTSVMLVGMTYALAFADEAQAIEAEKEMRMQQTANEVIDSLAVVFHVSIIAIIPLQFSIFLAYHLYFGLSCHHAIRCFVSHVCEISPNLSPAHLPPLDMPASTR